MLSEPNMPRVVPSQIVEIINAVWKTIGSGWNQSFAVTADIATILKIVNTLCRELPSELVVLPTEEYARYLANLAAIDSTATRSLRNTDHYHIPTLEPVPGCGQQNPLAVIRALLAKCPDEYPSKTTTELPFVEPDYREKLRLDMSAVERALSHADWKAATVLAGSVVEALLHWAVKEVSITAATAKRYPSKQPDPNHWNLAQFVDVNEDIGIITVDTATQCRLAKDFRNLIHPGRAIREAQVCNRGTAYSAVAALELVVQDLAKKFPVKP